MTRSKDLQERVLGALSIQGDMSVRELAKRLRLKSHLVQYTLKQLLGAGLIKRSVIIDHRALGLLTCNLLFNLSCERRSAALQFLQREKRVGWIFQNLGEREFEISVNVKTVGELGELVRKLGDATAAQLEDQLLAFDEDMLAWGYRYASPEYHDIKPIQFKDPALFEPDELDLEILRAFRGAPDSDPAALARHVGASASTLRYRLERLTKARVISNYRYFLVHNSGEIVQAQIRLSASVRTSSLERKLAEICQRTPQVTSLTTCVGNWDYKIVLHARSIDQLEQARNTLKQELSGDLSALRFCIRRQWLKASAGV